MRRYSGRKRKRTNYDRIQDAKIRKLARNITLKQHGTITDMVLSTGTLAAASLCLVPQGETDLTRESSNIHMKSVSIRWRATGSAVATVGTGAIRIMIVLDNDPRGATPSATQMLTTSSLLSAYNVGRVIGQERSRGRFKFIYDETYDMPTDAIASADQLVKSMTGKMYLPLKDTEVLYTGDSGAITEIEKNNLVVVAIPLGNTEDITVNFNSVLRFTAPD